MELAAPGSDSQWIWPLQGQPTKPKGITNGSAKSRDIAQGDSQMELTTPRFQSQVLNWPCQGHCSTPEGDSQWNWPLQGHPPKPKGITNGSAHSRDIAQGGSTWQLHGPTLRAGIGYAKARCPSRPPRELTTPGPLLEQISDGTDRSKAPLPKGIPNGTGHSKATP